MAEYDYDADRKRLEELSRKSGASVEDDDLRQLAEKAPEDREAHWAKLEAQYDLRGKPTSQREFDSQSGRYDTYTHELIDPGQATSQYSGSGGGMQRTSNPQLDALLSMLTQQQQQQQTERASLQQLLQSQLAELQQPVSVDSPGIKQAVTANRNALQRGGERQRAEIAERRAYDESGGIGSKAYLTDVDRLQQGQAEAGAQFEGRAVFEEMQQRRSELQRLLAQAMALGDSASARNLQAQLAAIQSQMQNSQFYAGLDQNQSQFLDNMGFNYAGLNSNMNLQALLALLNAA